MNSVVENLGSIDLPKYTGTRILMMPILLHDLNSIPDNLSHWKEFLGKLIEKSPCKNGTAYLTIDECELKPGEVHRRPGLHVDGWKDDSGNDGSWGGGGWGSSTEGEGMLLVASHLGSRGWNQKFAGEPKKFGDCEHLREQLDCSAPINFEPNTIFRLDGLTVHESIPVEENCKRQFVRLSMPSKANWNSSNTPNPLGILPDGPIVKPRPDEFTSYGAKYDGR